MLPQREHMITHNPTTRDFWSNRTGFILANLSAAVGLGSIWKFPYEVGANGGSAFLLFYFAGLLIIVLPLMAAELAIGRRGQSDAIGSISNVAAAVGASRAWSVIGLIGAITSALILSFYSVIGGWAIAFFLEAAMHGLTASDSQSAKNSFDALLTSPVRVTFYHTMFLAVTAFIVVKGIVGGIERAARLLMPLLVLLLLGLAVYGAVKGDIVSALRFLLALDTAHLTPRVALEALGLGFFSIGVGLATMITYAAYADKSVNLRQVALATILGDTAISLLAGLAIFPLVFAERLDPSAGAGCSS